MRFLIDDLENDDQIERLIKQRQLIRRVLELLKQIQEELRPCGLTKGSKSTLNQLLENYKFYVYRTDNSQVLARGIEGFDAAKEKANQLRKSLKLKWDQVKFKVDRGSSGSSTKPGSAYNQSNLVNPAGRSRVDYAKTYNSSKRMRFRGYTDAQGNYHDID